DREAAASQAELARLAADLDQMEQALRDLKALRERQKQTYSLVPYFGRHGDNRRPLYVECTAVGLVFHPDRTTLDGPALLPLTIRAEVERRIARQRGEPGTADGKGDKAELTPYLLMLVRPDGISSY